MDLIIDFVELITNLLTHCIPFGIRNKHQLFVTLSPNAHYKKSTAYDFQGLQFVTHFSIYNYHILSFHYSIYKQQKNYSKCQNALTHEC